MPSLAGRTVLVTGASTGIGRATARELARRGATVLAGLRDPSVELEPGMVPLPLDVTSPDDVAAAGEEAARRGLYGLVNNAGIAVTGPLEFLPLDAVRRQLEVNAIGQLAVTQACLPALHAARGRIVNLSSIGGRMALPMYGPYAASKYALEALSDSLRRELRGSVGVVVIEPGAIATPIWDRGIRAANELWDAMPAEAHDRYGDLVDAMLRIGTRQGQEGEPPALAATVIADALAARRPRTRYVIGRDARVQAVLARVLPDRVLDALLMATIRRRA